ncbi:MAG: hypothetical protein RBS01_02955 [Candidatus Dojkabacteria bacterium]|jgi:hypothetical protein|nr:hypothetical protein [Candidatus Dojkabacteria bacterium]
MKIVIPTLFLVLSTAFFIVFSAQAGTLAAVYIFMSRLKVNLNGSGAQAVQMILAIDTATSIGSGGTIEIAFPDDEDSSWCRTAGALTVTGVSSSSVDLSATNWQIDAVLPTSGTLGATCSQGGAGTTDKIVITAVGPLTAGTTYGVQIASNTGIIGTNSTIGEHILTVTASQGATTDSKSFKIYLLTDDAVVVSATVSAVPTVVCSISTNTVNLGTLYPGGTYATGSHTISTSTTGQGYYWAAYGTGDGGVSTNDAGLWRSGGTVAADLIRSGATATLDLTNATISGFGLTLSDPDGAGSAIVATNFSDASAGTFGTIDRLYAGAKLILSQNGSQGSAENSTVTYGAKAGATNPAGTYQETVYFVCGGYY